jgi:hypothetical protein
MPARCRLAFRRVGPWFEPGGVRSEQDVGPTASQNASNCGELIVITDDRAYLTHTPMSKTRISRPAS